MFEQGRSFVLSTMEDGIVEVLLDDQIDTSGKRCRKQQSLTIGGCCIEDSSNHRQKALIGHVVGFVEDTNLNIIEMDRMSAEVVEEPSGACNEDVDAGFEGLQLWLACDATKDRGDAQPRRFGKWDDNFTDLLSEFASRSQDERPGMTRTTARPAPRNVCDNRECKGEGLARTRSTLTEHISSGE